MEKKKGLSILKFMLIIICVSCVIVSLGVNILFSKKSTPHLFGRYIYIVEDPNPMSGDLTTGAALLAKDAANLRPSVGDIVLCYPADAPDKLSVRSISYIAEGDDGTESYYTKDALHDDTTDSIARDKIVAICTGYPENASLGSFVRFTQGIKGIIVLLVIPSVIIVIFIIAGIAKVISSKDDEDEFDFYEYDNDQPVPGPDPHRNGGDPLFEPEHDNFGGSELERKKMSIAEHFSQKEVNHDSPYQKEKERTMQFKAQKGSLTNTRSFPTGGSAETSFAARNLGVQSSTAPTADALREEMLRKTAEAERAGSVSVTSSAPEQERVSDNTGILSTAQVEELTRDEAPRYTAPRPSRQASAPAPAPKKSSSPDISDILSQADFDRKVKNPSDMSVDDLLKMIESEKSKL